ncbi:hypothetical protein BH11PLA1_BH11PLA1_00530 [soil metagenome]
MNYRRALALSVVAGSLLPVASARAVDGPNSVAGAPQWVGRVQLDQTAANNHNGSGAYLGDGVALTCAHVINERLGPGGTGSFAIRYENFQPLFAGGQTFAALGVQHPFYDPTGLYDYTQNPPQQVSTVHPADLGLLLTLNVPATPMGLVLPVLAGTIDPNTGLRIAPAVRNDVLQFSGFTVPGGGSAPRTGTLTVTQSPATPNPNFFNGVASYIPPPGAINPPARPANYDWTQPGDSGGPWYTMRNVGPGLQQVPVILGVTSYGDSANANNPNRLMVAATVTLANVPGNPVDNYLSFLRGDGADIGGGVQARVISELAVAGGVALWSGGNAWATGSGGFNADPLAFGIARLDPLRTTDLTTTVVVTAPVVPLDGLLNNVNLAVNSLLPITTNIVYPGAANGAGTTGNSGVLNGGQIFVNQQGILDSGFSVDNQRLILNQGGQIIVGSILAQGRGDTVFNNRVGGIFATQATGLSRVNHRLDNAGVVSTFGGTLEIGARLPKDITYLLDRQYSSDPGSTNITEAPIAVDNGIGGSAANFLIGDNGSVLVHNQFTSARFFNESTGQFNAAVGVLGTSAVGAIDIVENNGLWTVGAGGTVGVNRLTRNFANGTLNVTGGANGAAGMAAGILVNTGQVTVGAGGTLTAQRTPGLPLIAGAADPAGSLRNLANIDVQSQGKVQITGETFQAGRLVVRSAAAGRGEVTSTSSAANQRFVNTASGVIQFDRNGNANARPSIAMNGTTFQNDGVIRGGGVISITGNASFENRAAATVGFAGQRSELQGLHVSFDAATTGNAGPAAFVTMEAMSVNNGGANINEFNQQLALDQFCVTNASSVRLVSAFANESNAAAGEALYARHLYISANSVLDNSNFVLYYFDSVTDCGNGILGTVTNMDNLVRIPTPGAAGVLALGGMFAARRRRVM